MSNNQILVFYVKGTYVSTEFLKPKYTAPHGKPLYLHLKKIDTKPQTRNLVTVQIPVIIA